MTQRIIALFSGILTRIGFEQHDIDHGDPATDTATWSVFLHIRGRDPGQTGGHRQSHSGLDAFEGGFPFRRIVIQPIMSVYFCRLQKD